ncbi:CDP-6-deoxy-delta-3,4-glucoseen reductase [Leminorella grimontii]|uniref:CDP-6-deoxy-delta-3,4-glucoseen reductase n=1 Tax=Leminorella grimontii TaxID=82981 RepID=A0AAV5MYS6_9GAMM|nr:CDP-6-deoxy-delta-3,4-glucoseen reductase [Leminorella grimontii]KFC97632.1 CDP-6-deoxy-delta-3,4-glucoseen reductase-like [Leminorella grimontii ATCC 33999 = DSM 5078]GKX55005.1 CDP-6-deoxy-delta-3,4-glucoseen reductase [Leminorella grimontii]VFS57064.1 CDP-6-deoxy-L-threo-D-glycero-4-hexulose-3-dehydrase reductase [Leminorella grimontii]
MSHIIKIFPSSVEFSGKEDESILDSALKAGIHLEHSCKNGDCGVCESELLAGEAVDSTGRVFGQGERILTCNCKPRTDLQLQAHYFPELAGQLKKLVPCKVSSSYLVSDDVMKLKLRMPPTANIGFLPGQYVDLQYKGVTRSYSIANSNEKEGIELHIRNVPNGQMSSLIFSGLQENTLMRIEGPCGTFFIRDSNRPIIFLAGGTGFAPVKAMVEHLVQKQTTREIYIYWGMPRAKDFYSTLPNEWSEQYKNIHYIPVVSDDDQTWDGRKGFVHHTIIQDFDSLEPFDIYACGSPVMIDASKRDFIAKNLSIDNFYSDAFTASR